MPTSFLDDARECRLFAHELAGTEDAAFLVKIASAFEDLHAVRAAPATGRQKLEPGGQVSQPVQVIPAVADKL